MSNKMASKDYFSYCRLRDSKTDKRRISGDLKSDLRSPIESDYGGLSSALLSEGYMIRRKFFL